MKKTILIIEDDVEINKMLQLVLGQNGYCTLAAYSGTEGILAHNRDVSLILMDLMLPGKNGEEIIEELKKKNNVPVIVTSAIHDIDKKVELFSLGADDYVTKPFHMDELLARIAVRLKSREVSSVCGTAYRDIEMRKDNFTASCNGKPLDLSLHEFNLLLVLVENGGRICTKSSIFEKVWDDGNSADENTLNVHISKIRRKLKDCNPDEEYIETVWGVGCRLKKQ